MPAQTIPNTVKILVNAATITATGNSATFTLPLADSYAIYLHITAATGTTPTLDGVLQTTPDNGVTWLNLPLRFAQATAVSDSVIRFQPTMGLGEVATSGTVAATGGALALNTPFVGPQFSSTLGASSQLGTLRLAATVGGTTPSFTYTLYAIMAGRGNSLT